MTRRLLGYSYVMTHAEAMYKQACVTRFTMKQQLMKPNKRKRLNVGTYQRFYESVHHYHFLFQMMLQSLSVILRDIIIVLRKITGRDILSLFKWTFIILYPTLHAVIQIAITMMQRNIFFSNHRKMLTSTTFCFVRIAFVVAILWALK